jgi:hypothetical protein
VGTPIQRLGLVKRSFALERENSRTKTMPNSKTTDLDFLPKEEQFSLQKERLRLKRGNSYPKTRVGKKEL